MKITKKLLILFFFFGVGNNSVCAHPFYVSICQVDFNKENHSLEISLKVFADDLILGLENAGASKLYLGEAKENKKTDTYLLDYLKSSINFIVNGDQKTYSFVGKEMESDVVWIYLEIQNISSLNNITVDCKLLTEVLETQNNIIQINNGDGIKSMLLNKRKQSDTITYI
ncbi:hypothetical protein N9164_10675 [Draconibacterium sp.]|nr:hypothetical protein [Draconibacterium sp.]